MSDENYQMEKDNDNYTSSKVGCISPRAKIILSISIIALVVIVLVIIILVIILVITLRKKPEIASDMDYRVL